MKTAAQLREELAAAKKQLKGAEALRARLEQQLKMVCEEITELQGSLWGRLDRGRIGQLERDIAAAELREKHAQLPRVRVLDRRGDLCPEVMVLASKGPKQIGLTLLGHQRVTKFDAETGREAGRFGSDRIHPEDLERIRREGR